jgi:predicted small lipoprotein YifL
MFLNSLVKKNSLKMVIFNVIITTPILTILTGNMKRVIFTLCGCLLLTGCGHSGALYLPQQSIAPAKADVQQSPL